MRAIDIIRNKRRGEANSPEELRVLIQQCVSGTIPDYQLSAWLMAVLWRGMSKEETFALTGAMVDSGDTLDLSALPGPCVDKHSTGGVGDKTTLAVVPLLASAGVFLPKMSGRGLGHTGGTLDKLESLGGTRTAFTPQEIIARTQAVGACLCAQTARLVPADRLLYALRDATDTVESLPLIAASIMSKKLAGGCPLIVLDVKFGMGAFMKTLPEARALAELMIQIGTAAGRRAVAVLSNMDIPLGCAVGNRVEVDEVVRLLRNDPQTDPRLRTLVCTLAGIGFVLAGRASSLADGEAMAQEQIVSGSGFEKLGAIIEAQGGDVVYLTDPSKPPQALVSADVRAERGGWIGRIDAEAIGLAAMRLGAGRAAKDDPVDPAAGILLHKSVGSAVQPGEVVATLLTQTEDAARLAAPSVWAAFEIDPTPPTLPPVVEEIIGLDP